MGAEDITNALRAAIKQIGSKALGIIPSQVSAHSNRTGGAFALKLSGLSDLDIRMAGRWKSDSVTSYLAAHVASNAMLTSLLTKKCLNYVQTFAYQQAESPKRRKLA